MPFYAVARGKKVGIYPTWPECQAQVKGFPNARYKKFTTRPEAADFISENSQTASCYREEKKAKFVKEKNNVKSSASEKYTVLPFHQLEKTEDGYLKSGDRFVVYTDGASTDNQHKNAGGSGCGIYWGGVCL